MCAIDMEQPTGEVGEMTRARMPRPHEVAAARRDPRLLRAFHQRDEDLTWRARGVCQSVDPEVFFPAPSEPADAAVALCRTCDVQGACLAWAIEVGDCHGVWGATTPRERRAMLVAWRSDEFDTFDAFEAAAALPRSLAAELAIASDQCASAMNAPRTHGADSQAKTRVPSQRAGTACAVNEPRMGIEARHGLDTRLDTRKAPSREDAGPRRGATVGIAALA
jgi:WhiB family redox-sensing transcriptional regulator